MCLLCRHFKVISWSLLYSLLWSKITVNILEHSIFEIDKSSLRIHMIVGNINLTQAHHSISFHERSLIIVYSSKPTLIWFECWNVSFWTDARNDESILRKSYKTPRDAVWLLQASWMSDVQGRFNYVDVCDVFSTSTTLANNAKMYAKSISTISKACRLDTINITDGASFDRCLIFYLSAFLFSFLLFSLPFSFVPSLCSLLLPFLSKSQTYSTLSFMLTTK